MLPAKVYLNFSDVCDKVNLFVRIGDGGGSPPPECLEIQKGRKVKFLLESHSSFTHDLFRILQLYASGIHDMMILS